jgi:hypothetical protein
MSNRKAPEAPIASPVPTLTQDALNALIGTAVSQALAVQYATFQKELAEAKAAAKPNGKGSQSEQNILKARKVFARLGYKDIQPGTNILTFNKWTEQGLRPKEGEKSVRVNNLRLFHRDQCRPLTKDEAAAFKAKLAAKTTGATADQLPAVSPISAPVAPVRTSKAKTRKVIPISEITTAD